MGKTLEETMDNIRAIWGNMVAENKKLRRDLKDCRNELCLKCGSYREAHKGACDGCRWKDVG